MWSEVMKEVDITNSRYAQAIIDSVKKASTEPELIQAWAKAYEQIYRAVSAKELYASTASDTTSRALASIYRYVKWSAE